MIIDSHLQTDSNQQLQDRVTKLHMILGGDTTIALHLQFLIRTNKTDHLILKNTKVTTLHFSRIWITFICR